MCATGSPLLLAIGTGDDGASRSRADESSARTLCVSPPPSLFHAAQSTATFIHLFFFSMCNCSFLFFFSCWRGTGSLPLQVDMFHSWPPGAAGSSAGAEAAERVARQPC